jgi:hypothetical protein
MQSLRAQDSRRYLQPHRRLSGRPRGTTLDSRLDRGPAGHCRGRSTGHSRYSGPGQVPVTSPGPATVTAGRTPPGAGSAQAGTADGGRQHPLRIPRPRTAGGAGPAGPRPALGPLARSAWHRYGAPGGSAGRSDGGPGRASAKTGAAYFHTLPAGPCCRRARNARNGRNDCGKARSPRTRPRTRAITSYRSAHGRHFFPAGVRPQADKLLAGHIDETSPGPRRRSCGQRRARGASTRMRCSRRPRSSAGGSRGTLGRLSERAWPARDFQPGRTSRRPPGRGQLAGSRLTPGSRVTPGGPL